MKTILNYIYIILGAVYLWISIYVPDNIVFEYLKNNVTYGNEILSYFNAFVGVFTALGVIGLINRYIEKVIMFTVSKTSSNIDDIIARFIIKFFNVSKYLIAIYIGIRLAIIPESIQYIIDKFFNVSFIIVGLILLSSLVNSIFANIAKKGRLSKLSKQVFPILNKIVNAFIWIIGGITIIGNLGYDISALITGAGVGGLAIALAAKTSVSNIFGAISVIINKPFTIGDRITVNGHTGKVKDIGLTYLTLTDDTGYKILIPNENIISSSVENLTIRENRRTDFSIGLVYETTLDGLKKAVKIVENILEKEVSSGEIIKYRVNFDSFGDFSLNIQVTYFSLLNKDYTLYLKQKEKINLEIKKQFEQANLDMAFPTQEVILKK